MTPRWPPVPTPDRGDVWRVDLGIAAKTRPCLVSSVPPEPQERVPVTLVRHTSSVRETRFEVVVARRFLKPGAFDAQGRVTVALAQLARRLGPAETEFTATAAH